MDGEVQVAPDINKDDILGSLMPLIRTLMDTTVMLAAEIDRLGGQS